MSIEPTKPEVFLRSDLKTLTLMLFGPKILGPEGKEELPMVLMSLARRTQDAVDKLERYPASFAAEALDELQHVLNIAMTSYQQYPISDPVDLNNALEQILSITGYYQERQLNAPATPGIAG